MKRRWNTIQCVTQGAQPKKVIILLSAHCDTFAILL